VYRAAVAGQEKLVTDHPDSSGYRVELGRAYSNLGQCFADGGQPATAIEWLDKAIATVQPVLTADPRSGSAQTRLCYAFERRGNALAELGRHAEAAADFARALELATGANRKALVPVHAAAVARAGDPAKAVALVAELVAADGTTAGLVYDAACVHGIAAAQGGDPALAERYSGRAVELLRRAAIKGHRTFNLVTDTDFDSLRRRDDFNTLLWDLADLAPAPRK
jgi:tetratricopeptide (TPR) repeat protein